MTRNRLFDPVSVVATSDYGVAISLDGMLDDPRVMSIAFGGKHK